MHCNLGRGWMRVLCASEFDALMRDTLRPDALWSSPVAPSVRSESGSLLARLVLCMRCAAWHAHCFAAPARFLLGSCLWQRFAWFLAVSRSVLASLRAFSCGICFFSCDASRCLSSCCLSLSVPRCLCLSCLAFYRIPSALSSPIVSGPRSADLPPATAQDCAGLPAL